MEYLTIVTCVVIGILNIILFFKVWGMTNNVKQMKDIVCDKKLSRNEIEMIIINDSYTDEEVAKILSSDFLRESIMLYRKSYDDGFGKDYSSEYNELVSFYKKMYKLRPNIIKNDWLCDNFEQFKEKYKKTLL